MPDPKPFEDHYYPVDQADDDDDDEFDPFLDIRTDLNDEFNL
jgi:hypothetical protein